MEYQKNIRRKSMIKRIFITWCAVAIVFFMIGGVTGYVLKSYVVKIYNEKQLSYETYVKWDKG